MNLHRTENKARLAVALFVLALLLTIGLSLALYSQSRRDLAAQRLTQVKLEAALVASQLPGRAEGVSEIVLAQVLHRQKIKASAALYSNDGRLLAEASTLDLQQAGNPFAI